MKRLVSIRKKTVRILVLVALVAVKIKFELYLFEQFIRDPPPPKNDIEIKHQTVLEESVVLEGKRRAIFTDINTMDESKVKHSKKKQALIIVAGFRTGSSFLGQLFNQHRDVFYYFEPLFHNSWYRPGREANGDIIRDLLLCNTTSLTFELRQSWHITRKKLESTPRDDLRRKLGEIERCLHDGICFRWKSNKLCSPKICGNESATLCKLHCNPVTSYQMEKECLESTVRVIKVIRLKDIEGLKRSWEHPSINLKILHLVRDPRSSLVSRIAASSPEYAQKLIQPECDRDLKIHLSGVGNGSESEWMNGIYKLIRYEDVLESPLKVAESLYKSLNFFDFSISKDVIQWVQMNTAGSDGHIFGTSRNANEQKYKWRERSSISDVERVQTLCHDMMSTFGYKSVEHFYQLLNFTDTLIVNVPRIVR